jgi:hypothetical protein
MSFVSRDAQSQRQALAINDHMQFAREATARAPDCLVPAVSDACGMLVDAHY